MRNISKRVIAIAMTMVMTMGLSAIAFADTKAVAPTEAPVTEAPNAAEINVVKETPEAATDKQPAPIETTDAPAGETPAAEAAPADKTEEPAAPTEEPAAPAEEPAAPAVEPAPVAVPEPVIAPAPILPEAKDVKVQLNGKTIAFAEGGGPVLKDGFTYVPFRAIFDIMGAKVDYVDATKTITATLGDTTLTLVVGQKDIKVADKDGKEESVTTDAPSFIQNGRTYVPVRFISQAAGYSVGWNAEEHTVVIMDVDGLLAPYKGKFTIIDRYLAYAQEFNTKPLQFKGTFTMDLTTPDTTAETGKSTIKATGTISGITNADTANMKLAMKLDAATLEKLLAKDDATAKDPLVAALTEALKEIQFDYIIDLQSMKYYLSSPLFSTLMGSEANTWYSIDMSELFSTVDESGLDMASLMELSKSTSFEEYLDAFLAVYPDNEVEGYAALEKIVSLLGDILSDDAFTKEGDSYVSKFAYAENDINVNLVFSIKEAYGKIVGYDLQATVGMDETNTLKIGAAQNNKDATVNMEFALPDLDLSFVLDCAMSYQVTSEAPLTAPPADSNIVSLNDMINNVAIPSPEAEAATAVEATEENAATEEAPAVEAPAVTTPDAAAQPAA